MKKIFFVFGFLLFVNITSIFAQGEYDLRLLPGSLDCIKKTVTVCIEIKSNAAVFKLDGGNIQILYATNQLTNPRFKSRDNFSGGNYNKMDSLITLNTSGTAGLLGINITSAVNGADGTVVGPDFMKVACIEFDVPSANTTNCYNLSLSKSAPATVITKVGSVNSPTATQGTFTNIANQCPVSPVVSMTKGTGVDPSLIFTLTTGTVPATVTLTDGTTINMTQSPTNFPVSPTVQVTYQIQSVTSPCGAGSAATGSSPVTVTPGTTPPNSSCVSVKCAIVTAVKVTLP